VKTRSPKAPADAALVDAARRGSTRLDAARRGTRP
jgi:hypothetical protein